MKYIITSFILVIFVVNCVAQQDENASTRFGDKILIHSSYGYFQYSDKFDLDINIRYWDIQTFLYLNENWLFGLQFNKVLTSDFFKNKLDFFRLGPIVKYQDFAYNGNLIYYADISLNYGNFTINLDDEPEKRNLFFAGGSFGLDYRLVSNIFISTGVRFSRQLEKGDYGLELYPFVGLSYRF